jgi:hypothetical protein
VINQDGVSDAPTRKQGLKALNELVPLGQAIALAAARAAEHGAKCNWAQDDQKSKELWKIYEDLNTKAAEMSSLVRMGLEAEKWYPE